jgi:hypothetical protein
MEGTSDEYPMPWNELLERIHKYQELGLVNRQNY